MENAADALKIAFALLVFATAITTLFMLTSKSRATADAVFYYADDTNYYEHTDEIETNRVVTVSDVITTLYRYYKESLSVTIKFKDGNKEVFDLQQKSEGNTKAIEERLGNFIVNEAKLVGDNSDKVFLETFVEAPTSGMYIVDEQDGSEFTLSAGSKKVFITYEEIWWIKISLGNGLSIS